MARLDHLALIGFGEAGMAFASAWDAPVRAWDIKTDDPATASAKRADYARHKAVGTATLADALAGADLVISVVTADQALAAAEAAAACLRPGALYCDFNSVAPGTKQAATAAIEAAGGRYVDVAVMAPVHPALLAVPLLASGPHAEAAVAALSAIGFAPVRVDGPVGQASTIKMLRSVMVKGIEALTAECFLAARRAGVTDEVAASLDASWPGADWTARAAYNLDRMHEHGLRRAAEMDEVAKTLDALGQSSEMTRATANVQRRLGEAARTQATEAA
jgi:3-hydroxyisobutyrate dehydrogenase-like beta-hydroxyacid dehydrogenase